MNYSSLILTHNEFVAVILVIAFSKDKFCELVLHLSMGIRQFIVFLIDCRGCATKQGKNWVTQCITSFFLSLQQEIFAQGTKIQLDSVN